MPPSVRVFPTLETLSHVVAENVADLIRNALAHAAERELPGKSSGSDRKSKREGEEE